MSKIEELKQLIELCKKEKLTHVKVGDLEVTMSSYALQNEFEKEFFGKQPVKVEEKQEELKNSINQHKLKPIEECDLSDIDVWDEDDLMLHLK